ncbi:MAG: DegT/DnrJ/EryC1/StrS family aminotransferase [Candidatus Promineifilaceae bacterium]
MTWRIPLADLDYGPEEEAAVQAVVRGRWLTMGEETRQFEEEFASFTGAKHAIAVTNCTAALHLAAVALGLGPEDEVIVPSLSFVATANGIRYTGATPVFADICGEYDLNLDPADIAAKITPKTRAIVVMHYGGYPVNMPAILELAGRYDLAVIEDAAHAPGSELDGRHLGTWGDIGCFSFFSNKNLATGEGGMLTTDDDALAEKLRLVRSHGMTSLTWDRHKGHAFSYDVVAPGYNYRLDEIRAALGRVQLRKLTPGNRRRAELNQQYEEMLATLTPELTLPFFQWQGTFAYHLRPVLLPPNIDRSHFMTIMKEQGIQTSIHYPPIHQFQYYRQMNQNNRLALPKTEQITGCEVTLPLFPGMTADDVETVCCAVQTAFAQLKG